MKNLPPLTKVLDKGPESGHEFERLMKKLLIHDGSLKGYVFEPGVTYRDEGIDGMVKKNYPGMDCPVIFQFKWLEGPINKGNPAAQIKNAFTSLVKSDIKFKSYVLITPNDLKPTEKKWLEELPTTYGKKIDIFHYGHTQIQVLLDAYTALKKYYYGEQVEGVSQNFNAVKEKYRKSIIEEEKHLHFIGMPTGSYQKQHLLEKPELAKIYIPLDFNEEKDSSKATTLDNILKKSNRVVVLGDPGSGKSTLAKYLALIYSQEPGENKRSKIEGKIPFIIPIREFVRMQQEKKSQTINFIDYLKYISEANYAFNNMDKDFFIAMLEMGKAIVVFDGLDEVASESGRTRVAKNIQQFSLHYPDSPVWVTSRIVGYTVNVKIDAKVFDHYHLTPVTPEQASEFIEKWYEIQIPKNETLRKDRVQSLQNAIEENPGVHRLKTNPLLLTMMTLVHQFEGTLPDDRAKLYEKCIELLLKTWQDQKYMTLGIKNPLEERDLNYNDQLKMLAATAFYIQGKNQGLEEDTRGFIEEKELEQVLFKIRFNKKRMSEDHAKEDVKIFLDYIRERTGLLVEKGRNEKGENVFAFVHLSFLEYLCAYQVAEDKSKSQKEHIRELLGYMNKPAWEEPILLSLYLFAGSTGPSFIDAFSEAVIEKLTDEPAVIGWFLLGRAVRDNIKFALDDIKKISGEILKIYLDSSQEDIAFTVLKEIVQFSKEGKNILKNVINETIRNNPAEKAFEFLHLYKQLYEVDSILLEVIYNTEDCLNLLAYLPVYRDNEIFTGFIDEKLKESQWVLYYNSAADKTNKNLEQLITGKLKLIELKGYTISCWTKIFLAYQERGRFLEINQSQLELTIRIDNILYDFGGYAYINYPLTLFHHFMEDIGNVNVSKISNQRFLFEDRKKYVLLDAKFLADWLCKILLNTLWDFEENIPLDRQILGLSREQMTEKFSDLSRNLSRYFNRDFTRYFSRYLSRDFSQDFSRYFSRYFSRHFSRYLSREFSRYFNRDFSIDLNRELSRHLSRAFSQEFCGYFSRYLSRDFSLLSKNLSRYLSRYFYRDFNRDLRDFISILYLKRYNEELELYNLSGKNEEKIDNLFMDVLGKGDIVSIDKFFGFMFIDLMLEKFQLSFDFFGSAVQSFSGKKKAGVTQNKNILSVINPLVIPFIFNFVLSATLIHYFLNILSDLNRKFHNKKHPNEQMIIRAIDNYIDKNPFEFYFITFSWDFYSKAFNERYQKLKDGDEKDLALAAFVVNAARVSLVAGVPCEGEEWEKTLKEAGKSTHPFVQISLTLYKLCNFIDREKNSGLLTSQLEKFKHDYPAYYKLIGFQED